MILPEGLFIVLFAAISLLSAAAAVVLTGYLQNVVSRARLADVQDDGQDGAADDLTASVAVPIRYGFAEGMLVTELRDDDPFLAPDIDRGYAPLALSEAMVTLHPELPDRMNDLLTRGEPFHLIGHLGPDALSVVGEAQEDRLVVIVAPASAAEGRVLDRVAGRVEVMRRMLGMSGDLQWTQTDQGHVTWCNDSYLKLSAAPGGDSMKTARWPLARLFGEQLDPPPTDGNQRRCYITRPGLDIKQWFEATAVRLSTTEVLFSARPVDRLVTAETSLRDFVQTLSKTFATLPVGLAVFDAKRELVLFNPALVSVSRLDPGYLTRRPTLRAFLDQLRENQRMPEPRDYRSWREEIELLEQGAEQDRYHEIWTLPSGETLRVTGRPHPNGAVAFLFEDISQEVSLTRRFRSDLDLDRGILDDLPAGLIVFSREGEVLRTNAAYRVMLRDRLLCAPETIAALEGPEATLTQMAHIWREVFQPSGIWGDIRQFARHEIDRAAWSETVTEQSGAHRVCRVAPLRGGNTIVWFLPPNDAWTDSLTSGTWGGLAGTTRKDAEELEVVEVPRQGEGAA